MDIAGATRRHSCTGFLDADIAARLDEGKHPTLEPQAAHRAWLQVTIGKVAPKSYPLETGDAVALANESEIMIAAHVPGEVIVFDLPGT